MAEGSGGSSYRFASSAWEAGTLELYAVSCPAEETRGISPRYPSPKPLPVPSFIQLLLPAEVPPNFRYELDVTRVSCPCRGDGSSKHEPSHGPSRGLGNDKKDNGEIQGL